MSNESIYQSIFTTKTGSKIPVLKNGKTIESKYNPEREADTIISQIEKKYNFFIVIGTGSGIIVSKLLEKFNNSFILGLEYSQQDLDFIAQLPDISELKKNKNVVLTDYLSIQNILPQIYNPVIHGNIRIIENRAWINENHENYLKIKNSIDETIRKIGMDYSAQCHFGKIWQKNCIKNLKSISQLNQKFDFMIPVEKKALIVAAGPTLDEKIPQLKLNQTEYFIISTDTVYKTLQKNKIKSDIVVSLDAQFISSTHFTKKISNSKTIFLFEICSNFSAINKCLKSGNVYLYSSNHPLSIFSQKYFNETPLQLENGAGTVTITALDFAVKAGFKEIEIIGADFSYSKGKAYTKGTYLEENFSQKECKVFNSEAAYDRLLYRTKLEKKEKNIFTTETLENYKSSLLNYFNNHKLNYKYEDFTYFIENPDIKSKFEIKNQLFDYKNFLNELILDENKIVLLPFMAYLQNKTENKDKSFEELYKVAHNLLLSYN